MDCLKCIIVVCNKMIVNNGSVVINQFILKFEMNIIINKVISQLDYYDELNKV